MAKEKSGNGAQLAAVDDYPERPYEEAKAEPVEREQVDQITDYHKTHKTLDTSGPEHDPEKQAEAQSGAAEEQAKAESKASKDTSD